jgi:hypothetical protein
MATMTQPAPMPGTRVRKTTETEILPARGSSPDDARPSEFYAREWETVVHSLTAEQWAGHVMRVYRADEKWDRSSSPVDNTFTGPFTEEDMRNRFGGGRYLLWLYGPPKKQTLVGRYQVNLDGPPLLNGIPRNGTPEGSNSVALEAMRMYSNPEFVRMQMQMMITAATEAMALMKSQIPAPQNPLETLRAAKEILGSGDSGNSLIAHITLLKELGLIGSPEKKGISEVLETLNAFKTAGLIPSGAPKADLASTFAANLPMLADRLVNGLHEFRLQAESQERAVRMARGEMRPGDPNVITVDRPPSTSAPQNGATADSSAKAPYSGATADSHTQAVSPEVAQSIIVQAHLHRLVNGIKQPNATGQDMYDYLRNAWPEILDELGKMNKETLLAFFKSRETQMQYFGCDLLAEVADDPRLPKMIEDFLKIAKEDSQAEAAAVTQQAV